MIRLLFLQFILILPILSFAVTTWQIVPKDSTLTFTATQNNAPVSGKFNQFDGDIQFDPADLTKSQIKISVDLNSVATAYKDVGDTLKTSDWFNVKIFPKAEFKANEFSKTGDQTYTAKGTLSIRDKIVPTTLTFTLDEYTDTKAHAKGEAVIKRTAFGVGQGEWSDTNAIKDDVKINFVISTVKK